MLRFSCVLNGMVTLSDKAGWVTENVCDSFPATTWTLSIAIWDTVSLSCGVVLSNSISDGFSFTELDIPFWESTKGVGSSELRFVGGVIRLLDSDGITSIRGIRSCRSTGDNVFSDSLSEMSLWNMELREADWDGWTIVISIPLPERLGGKRARELTDRCNGRDTGSAPSADLHSRAIICTGPSKGRLHANRIRLSWKMEEASMKPGKRTGEKGASIVQVWSIFPKSL